MKRLRRHPEASERCWRCVNGHGILTVQAVDTHHQVNTVIKLFIIFLRGEIRKIRSQERKVAVQAGMEAQLLEQLLFCFVETGGGTCVLVTISGLRAALAAPGSVSHR